jgi:protein-disulfide isomerase
MSTTDQVFADINKSRIHVLETSLLEKHKPFLESPAHPKITAQNPLLRVFIFQDYQCSHCVQAHSEIEKIKGRYPGKIEWITIEYPIFGGLSVLAAEAALLANQSQKHSNLSDALFELKEQLTEQKIYDLIKLQGIKRQDLRKVVQKKVFYPTLEFNKKQGAKFNIESTPTFLIGNQIIQGNIHEKDWEKLIKEASQKKS